MNSILDFSGVLDVEFSPVTVLTRTVDIIIEQKNILVDYLSHLLMGDQGIVLPLTYLQRTTVCLCKSILYTVQAKNGKLYGM